jgi:hypothetical protein
MIFFILRNIHHILLRRSDGGDEWDGALSSSHGMSTKFWKGNVNGREPFGEMGARNRIILKLFWKKYAIRMWTGCIWFMQRAVPNSYENPNFRLLHF